METQELDRDLVVDEQPEPGEPIEPGDVDEPEPEHEPEPEPDDEPNAGVERASVALMEEQGKKLDRLEKYVSGKLVEIFGKEESDSLHACELCSWTRTFGWRVDTLPPDFVREAVKNAIGLGTVDEMNAYTAFETCETCNGLGNVRTGSKVTQFLYRTCPSCKGRGYSSTLDEDADRLDPVAPIAAAPRADGGPAVEPDVDMFGTPRGHPDYGKLAQHREVPISYWQDQLPANP